MRETLVEYLGLPGVGKTWQLDRLGYCGRMGAHAHSVWIGGGWAKANNTLKAIVLHPRLCALLVWSLIHNFRSMKNGFDLRPVLVVFERIGRFEYLNADSKEVVHVDEGPYQFLWRSFCEKKISTVNIETLKKSVQLLDHPVSSVAYISSSRAHHFIQIKKRNKIQPFDLAVYDGDEAYYRRSRTWMAHVVRFVRQSGVKVHFVRNRFVDAG